MAGLTAQQLPDLPLHSRHPGASAHQVELEVTDVLEKNIRTMGNIDNIESYSYNDLSLIQIELLSTVPDDEVEQCWDMLRRKVSDAHALLPEGATPPIVKDDFGNVYGMFYALTGDGLSDRELSDYAELVKREVNELEGVDRVDSTANVPNVSTSPCCKTVWQTSVLNLPKFSPH